jgi:ATP-binding cassette subfamily F protein uup
LQRLERELAKLDRRESDLLAQIAEQAADYTAVAALDTELRSVREQKETTEHTWLELSDF